MNKSFIFLILVIISGCNNREIFIEEDKGIVKNISDKIILIDNSTLYCYYSFQDSSNILNGYWSCIKDTVFYIPNGYIKDDFSCIPSFPMFMFNDTIGQHRYCVPKYHGKSCENEPVIIDDRYSMELIDKIIMKNDTVYFYKYIPVTNLDFTLGDSIPISNCIISVSKKNGISSILFDYSKKYLLPWMHHRK